MPFYSQRSLACFIVSIILFYGTDTRGAVRTEVVENSEKANPSMIGTPSAPP